VVFWLSVLGMPYILIAGLRRRDWQASLILTAFASQYFAWYLAARTAFLFYMTPITPFMVLALTYGLRDLSEVRLGENRVRALAPVAWLVVLASVVIFAFFFPVLTGRVISYSAWRQRMWLGSWI
jgi:dolichyl-phosphate-mannose--protein O-mannosyl transferase